MFLSSVRHLVGPTGRTALLCAQSGTITSRSTVAYRCAVASQPARWLSVAGVRPRHPSSHGNPDSDKTLYGRNNAVGGRAQTELVAMLQWKPKLVIFDKNGTLINFHRLWSPWIQELAKRLERETGLCLQENIYRELNVCRYTQRARSGMLGEGTTSQIKRSLEEVIYQQGVSRRQAQMAVETCWEDCDTSNPEALRQLADLKELFHSLHSQGVKIAVLTSDLRKSTLKTLDKLNLISYVDKLVCGDDHYRSSKTARAANSVEQICNELCVAPCDAVVIGDTASDVKMGYDAGVGLTLGVLSGIGNRLDLVPFADHTVETVQDAVDMMSRLTKEQIRELAEIRRGNGIDVEQTTVRRKASLVIFDKDGTLLCFNSMWTPWAKELVQKLEKHTGKPLSRKLLAELGFCHTEQKWRPGMLAEGTTGQNRTLIEQVLQEEGLTEEEAQRCLAQVWQPGDHSETSVKTLDNPTALFKTLKEHDIKVAVCTADSRASTARFLRLLGAEPYVDMLVCGDDPNTVPKPAAHNALMICESLDVPPAEAVVVGDTIADLGMGKSAKLGACIAVLSGVGNVKDLEEEADHVIPSIKHVLPHVLPHPL